MQDKTAALRTFLAVFLALTLSLPAISGGAVGREVSASSVSQCLGAFGRLNPGNDALRAKAAGALVFPRVEKGGAPGLRSEQGNGVLLIRGEDAGTYRVETPGRGPTLGVAYHQLVILFMNAESLGRFQRQRTWTVSDEVGLPIVAAGHRSDYDEKELGKSILAFVYGEEGLFDNLYLRGSVVRRLGP